jgi:hypothetical protein
MAVLVTKVDIRHPKEMMAEKVLMVVKQAAAVEVLMLRVAMLEQIKVEMVEVGNLVVTLAHP